MRAPNKLLRILRAPLNEYPFMARPLVGRYNRLHLWAALLTAVMQVESKRNRNVPSALLPMAIGSGQRGNKPPAETTAAAVVRTP